MVRKLRFGYRISVAVGIVNHLLLLPGYKYICYALTTYGRNVHTCVKNNIFVNRRVVIMQRCVIEEINRVM